MGWSVDTPGDRRRDRRVCPPGTVVICLGTPGPAHAAEVRGRLVDVSAGGLRVIVSRKGLRPGQEVQVEVRLGNDQDTMPPPVRLRGFGRVVRVEVGPRGETEAAVRFEAPLAVRDAYPSVSAYA